MENEHTRLKKFRKSFSLTQDEFAKALKIKQASLSDVERGKVKVSAGLMAEALKKYRLNPFWLIEGKGIMQLTLTQYNLMTSDVLYPVQEESTSVQEGGYPSDLLSRIRFGKWGIRDRKRFFRYIGRSGDLQQAN